MMTALATISIGALNYYRTSDKTLDTAIENLADKTRLLALRFQDAYNSVQNEAIIASRTPPIKGLMRSMSHHGVDPKDGSTTALWKSRLEEIFTSIMQANPHYTQMRYIGLADHGRELVRVNKSDDGYVAVSPEDLQQKGNEPYMDAVEKGRHTFFFSKVTMNREHGDVGKTITPTIRAVMPVKDAENKIFGVLVINVDFNNLMQKMFYSSRSKIEAFLTNQSGDYVEYDPKKGSISLEYHGHFTKKQPEFIRKIQNDNRDEAVYKDGDDIIYYTRMEVSKRTDDEYVGAILRIPRSELLKGVHKTQQESLLLTAILIILTTLFATLMAHKLTQPFRLLTKNIRKYKNSPESINLPTERTDELGELARAFKDAFEQVLQSESTRKAYVDASGDGYWDWLIQDDYEYMSPQFWEMFGYKPEEKEHKPYEWQAIVFKEDLKASLNNFDKHVKTKGAHPYSQEVRYHHKDGSIITVLCKGAVVEWANDGTPIRMIGTHTNLTDIKKTQEQLYLLQLAIEYSKDLILITEANPDNPVTVYVNKASKDILGCEPKELIGKIPNFLKREESNALEFDKIKKALINHKPFNIERIHYAKDGQKYWVDINAVPVENTKGNVSHYISIGHDITDKKTFDLERDVLISELERSNKDLDDFAYVASHDLKAPLRVINNASTWLQEDLAGKLDEDSQENLELLRNRAVRMDKLLDDLLVYSRVGRVQSDEYKQIIDGVTLIEEIKELLSDVKQYSIHLNDAFKAVKIYRMPLQQIFLNLISNSIKHGDKETTELSVDLIDEDEKYLTFKVKDNGPGIPKEFHQKIFNIFQTLKPRDQVEGSGMGLAIVKKHIEIAGGEIKVDSDKGEGCMFTFTWPKLTKS